MLLETETGAAEIAPLLLEANFWFPPSLTFPSLQYLSQAISEGGTAESVARAFVRLYERNQWEELRRLLSTWSLNPLFQQRRPIIEDALQAHIEVKYTLVVPALLAQAEGIASSILGVPAGHSTQVVKDVIQTYQGDFLRSAARDNLLRFATRREGFGGVRHSLFTGEAYSKWIRDQGLIESQVLNRHAILHGVQLDYASKENSLRCFLLLDVLFWMKRDDWDPRASLLSRPPDDA